MPRQQNNANQGTVFKLIFINVAIFTLQILMGHQLLSPLIQYFALTPALVVERFYVWQVATYMFLHGNMLHIFFNMYALLIFGIPIEQEWGSRRFLLYYLFTGIGAGVSIFFINLLTQGPGYVNPTIGASGAVFGLLLAFGMLYPNAQLLIFFFIPVRAKYLVVIYGLIELYLELSSATSNISHVGHLGGIFFGLLYFFIFRRRSLSFKSRLIKSQILKNISAVRSQAAEEQAVEADTKREYKISLLKKLEQAGYASLSDDDVQFINYMRIMHGESEGMCKEIDFNSDDPYCLKCENFDACFVRRVNKYFS